MICDHGHLHHSFVKLKDLACSLPDLEYCYIHYHVVNAMSQQSTVFAYLSVGETQT